MNFYLHYCEPFRKNIHYHCIPQIIWSHQVGMQTPYCIPTLNIQILDYTCQAYYQLFCYYLLINKFKKKSDVCILFCRGSAMSLTVTCGRIGAIVGNVIFGLTIDLNCIIPIYTFGALLISKYMIMILYKSLTIWCLSYKVQFHTLQIVKTWINF